MSGSVLEVTDLKTHLDTARGELRAVDGVDIELRKGECFALVGESGSGKSMAALSIMRLLPETGRIAGGRVLLDGNDLMALPEAAMRAVRGRRVAMIFQEPATALNPVLTVGRQIAEVIERHTALAGDAVRKRTLELLDAVGIPDAVRRCEEYPFQLSGGLKQRVMIAAALAAEPEVLIADEPTTALDVTIQAQILDLLAKLQAERAMAILLITHDMGIVARMAQRVAVMYAGEIVEVAGRDAFFGAPQHPYAQKLFQALPSPEKRGAELSVIAGQVPPLTGTFDGCRFVERCDFAYLRCRREAPELIAIPGDRAAQRLVRCHLREQGLAPAPQGAPAAAQEQGRLLALNSAPVLAELENLGVHFPIRKGLFKRTVGQVKAVDGVSLAIRPGRTLALVGESGCGKTTAGKALLRLIPATAGRVAFAGRDLAALTRRQLREGRGAMQIIFQDPYASLDPRMRIADVLAEGMISLGIGRDAKDRMYRMAELLEQVGLPLEALSRYPHEFSGGQRQRIAIARALAVEPKLIVCDEPTSALDVSVQAQILNLLKSLQDRLGLAYLFITHNISIVEYLAHEVAVMYLGRIVERGTVEEVLGSPQHPYTEALLSAVPAVDGRRSIIRLAGELPSPANPPAGCHFHPRCPKAMPECRAAYPEAVQLGGSRSVSCVLYRASKAASSS
ncbi:MAG: ABC transporter ATP-binding protein [Betaproteobacteria bacterium RBG_16_66_20]|nr:MAG: ABC transporter ATP-binding protein [Betaproteobacteria bacterium RBG_16_66_20]